MTLITLATCFLTWENMAKSFNNRTFINIFISEYRHLFDHVHFGLFVYLSFKLGHELHGEMNQTSLFTDIFTVPIAMYLHILGTDKLILNKRIK